MILHTFGGCVVWIGRGPLPDLGDLDREPQASGWPGFRIYRAQGFRALGL